ncbi:hypothetical protein [Synechococcus sp. PCC 6312]|uniref:hypothetical protein n=1 Tax=Synechococcus sp. (strain ATCC 27167 / PCC 6312) TaxID=195253 RepID=UPI00029EFB73|nr:hypothetical protein [Synechococcus sp. PCC 6312]AFY61280.1 hypothetical protein Syn6312_2162 [Synechococcus sp. PCC 6312]
MGMDEVYRILDDSSEEHRQNLAELIDAGFGSSPGLLCDHIRYLRYGTIGQFFADPDWKQIVTDVADHLQIDWLGLLGGRTWEDLATAEIETAIVCKLFQEMLITLPPEQQQELLRQIDQTHHDLHLEGLLLTGGVMTLAKMSGFGVYVLASSVLGGLTSALGITLPFAVYIGMSQIIALVLGPVGWLALLAGVFVTINQPNWQRLTLAVVYISLIRASRYAPSDIKNMDLMASQPS